MRYSQFFIPTLKEDPAEAEVVSHKLMVRAGMLRKVASGIYSFLPLGLRVLARVERIIREEMNRAGAQEVLLPALQPAELWQKSGRWAEYGPEMMRLKDRSERDFCLGPTHEELITSLVMNEVRSYRQLPVTLYQIQVKFRDEIRPRFGLMRGREFIMKDAYSFDADEQGLEESYQKMYAAYSRILERCGLKYRAVEAATGIIGGEASQEFMVLADSGEDGLAYCDKCTYAANLETAQARKETTPSGEAFKNRQKVLTAGQRSVEEVSQYLMISPYQIVKTLIYQADGNLLAILVRGDREVNEAKLRSFLGTDALTLLDEKDFDKYPELVVGYVGPVGLKNCSIIADNELLSMANFVLGANEKDYHFINVNLDRDFKVNQWGDFTLVKSGDGCPRCEGKLVVTRGIEVGHVFKLGTKYSKAMAAVFSDEKGALQPFIMGCYGIGVSRLVAAAIEQNYDEQGIIWPLPLAPFEAIILVLNWGVEGQRKIGQELYVGLQNKGIEVLLDDRLETPGTKFADADLIGFPLQVIVGKRAVAESKAEVKIRRGHQKMEFPLDNAVAEICALLHEES